MNGFAIFFYLNVLTAAYGRRMGGGSRCYSHEEARQGMVTLVDCHGNAYKTISKEHYGKYTYKAEQAGGDEHIWTASDRRMSRVEVDAKCNHVSIDAIARCLEVPFFFVWCASNEKIQWVSDTLFPRDVEDRNDMLRVTKTCFGTNATARVMAPVRPVDMREVDEAEAKRNFQRDVVTVVILVVIVICLMGCLERRNKKYGRV